jgi:hypothetical protein
LAKISARFICREPEAFSSSGAGKKDDEIIQLRKRRSEKHCSTVAPASSCSSFFFAFLLFFGSSPFSSSFFSPSNFVGALVLSLASSGLTGCGSSVLLSVGLPDASTDASATWAVPVGWDPSRFCPSVF